MRPILQMLRVEPYVRRFFLAHAQSAFGTGIGYVALLLIAYEREPGPWGITFVLLADFLPAIVLGPLFGAAADRWSRRTCAVLADLARAIAFTGIALVGGIEATVALALLAGFGTGLYQPSILSGLPALVERERVSPAMSLYGQVSELGALIGPAVAAGLLVLISPEALLIANGVTFAISAVLLATLPLGRAPRDPSTAPDQARPSLFADARDGVRAVRRIPGVATVIVGSCMVLLFAGMLNVVELLYAKNDLDAGDSGFSVLVALSGLGVLIGNGAGSRGGTLADLRRRFLAGILIVGLGLAGMAVAPVFLLACLAFVALGFGNGLVLVHGRLALQRIVPEGMLGRVYGIKDGALSAAFGIAFVTAGALVDALDTRTVLALAAAGAVLTWVVATPALRRSWPADQPEQEPPVAVAGGQPLRLGGFDSRER